MSVSIDLIQKEKKRVYLSALSLNLLLSIYFWSLIYYFLHQNSQLSSPLTAANLVTLLALAITQSIIWTRSENSTGWKVIQRTNRLLKNLKDNYQGKWIFSFSGIYTCLLVFLTLLLGVQVTESSFYALFSYEGMTGAKRIFMALFQPNWAILSIVLTAMVETIFIALLATLLAIPLAFTVSFLSARNLMKHHPLARLTYNFFRLIANFTRSVEPIIWAIIFSVWVGIGPFAGMLALMVHSVASLVKLYSEQIENIDQGPIEAIEATGAHPLQVVWFAIVPQVVVPFLSYTIYRWDINVRMATIIGLVGGGGVGTLLMQYQGLAKWNEVGTIVIVIAIVVWLMDYLSAKLREAIY